MINFRAVKQLILVSIRVFSILKSPLAEKGTPHLQIFEFHKKSPEIDVSTTDLAALKIWAKNIEWAKSYLDFSTGGGTPEFPPLSVMSPR